jgi:glucose-6-phosphate 1-dehydrogenase
VEIRVQFKDATAGIFTDIPRNELVIRVQPEELIYWKMNTKTPGFVTKAVPVELDLTYKKRFVDAKVPQAYEALIWDAFKGDHSNFVRDDELDVAWKIFTPILHWIDGKDGKWAGTLATLAILGKLISGAGEKPKPESYEYGSRGPKSLEQFTAKYGFKRSDDGE